MFYKIIQIFLLILIAAVIFGMIWINIKIHQEARRRLSVTYTIPTVTFETGEWKVEWSSFTKIGE